MKILAVIYSMLSCLIAHSQLQKHDDIKILVSTTINTEHIEIMRRILSANILEIEKPKFTEVYDLISNAFYTDLQVFYLKEYSQKEITDLMAFYKSPTGSKLANDLRHLSGNNFPPEATLEFKLEVLRKKFHSKNKDQEKKLLSDKPVYSEIKDISDYKNLIALKEHLELVKEYEVMWIEPQYEDNWKAGFDFMATEFIEDVEKYFSYTYTETDKIEIAQFYSSDLGKKVAKNAGVLAKLVHDANQIWADGVVEIQSGLIHGRYQKD